MFINSSESSNFKFKPIKINTKSIIEITDKIISKM